MANRVGGAFRDPIGGRLSIATCFRQRRRPIRRWIAWVRRVACPIGGRTLIERPRIGVIGLIRGPRFS